ncbi:unnamed protein product [Prorocentrum cordatum]|uniref:Uncharacterized protein n=1 Tax=Prorocentrum cordatum TaxID=2364126 RepID=A0ABN9W023_9DINO|nr:unnamed protein product [Polarella glacialis]
MPMPPSVGSVATSPRALDSASPAAEELLESPSRMVREVDGASPAVDELLASESRMMEAEASLMRSPELSDLKGALSSMQDSVESLNRSGVLAYNRQDVTYDDELQLTSGTGGPAGGSEPSPIMSVSSPTQPATSHQAVELGGFKTEAFNDLFRPNAQLMVNDQPTWWSKQGWFLFYNAHRRTWCIAKGSSLDRVRAGKSHGNAWSPEGYDLLSGPALEPPRGWKEWDAEARQWVSRPGSGLRSPPRPLEEARSPGAPERGRLHRPEVHRSPRPVHLGPAASPERPAPPLPPPAEPPAGEVPLGSWSPPSQPHAPHGELDAAQRPGGRLW